MPSIKVRESEHIDSALRRLKRLVEKSGTPKELRKREFHQPNSKIKQRMLAAARKRLLKKILREKAQLLASCVRARRERG